MALGLATMPATNEGKCPQGKSALDEGHGFKPCRKELESMTALAPEVRLFCVRASAEQLWACSSSFPYSNLRDSTGSNCAARVAGSVPKTTPTSVAAASAMIADSPEMGMRYEVKSLTE